VENPEMAGSIISVQDFSYSYKGTTKRALDHVNLSVDEFECCAILGPAEAGKTTLCHAISSVLSHYFSGGVVEGRISTAGLDSITTPLEEMMKRVGFLIQNSTVYLTGIKPTVTEEIAFSMENIAVKRIEIIDRVQTVMSELGIDHLAHRDPMTLSGGETQRVALACVLSLDPQILILDEPTSSLDQEGIRDLRLVLKRLKGNKTILLIDQRMELLPGLADRILVLRDGKSLYHGFPEPFFSDPNCMDQGVGAPIWTEVYLGYVAQSEKQVNMPAFTYRQALKALERIN
jgi:energy-coupling factor transporter ATP-binding protein EcfA2